MPKRVTSKPVLLLCCVIACAIFVSGCARHRPLMQNDATLLPPDEPSLGPTLEEIQSGSRNRISHSLIKESAGGTLLQLGDDDLIDRLTLADCLAAAAKASPIAAAIDKENQQLQCRENVPKCLSRMLQLQAQHERNLAAGQAGQTFLNLAGVYLQHDVLIESTDELKTALRIVEKVKASDLPIEFDERSLHRQQNGLEQKAIELLYGQKRLANGLQLLLDLERSDRTIWTDWQSVEPIPDVELELALETAWANRGDLQAMELLVECCSAELLDVIQSSARSLHPLLGLAFSKKRLLPSRRRLQQERQNEACCRAAQIRKLIEAKKKLIEAEITELVFSIQKRQRTIQVKKETIASYRASITAAEKGAVLKPVDLKVQLENKAKALQEKSAMFDEVIQLEVDLLKLKQAQGLLGR